MNWKIAIVKPVERFLDSCSLKDQTGIKKVFNLFEEFGLSLAGPYLKRVVGTKELWEFRIKNIRLLFFVRDNQAVVLHGFVKKSWRIPKQELKVAEKRRQLIGG